MNCNILYVWHITYMVFQISSDFNEMELKDFASSVRIPIQGLHHLHCIIVHCIILLPGEYTRGNSVI